MYNVLHIRVGAGSLHRHQSAPLDGQSLDIGVQMQELPYSANFLSSELAALQHSNIPSASEVSLHGHINFSSRQIELHTEFYMSILQLGLHT